MDDDPFCVRMLKATVLVVEQPEPTRLAGLKLQEAFAGSPEQLIAIEPVYTLCTTEKL